MARSTRVPSLPATNRACSDIPQNSAKAAATSVSACSPSPNATNDAPAHSARASGRSRVHRRSRPGMDHLPPAATRRQRRRAQRGPPAAHRLTPVSGRGRSAAGPGLERRGGLDGVIHRFPAAHRTWQLRFPGKPSFCLTLLVAAAYIDCRLSWPGELAVEPPRCGPGQIAGRACTTTKTAAASTVRRTTPAMSHGIVRCQIVPTPISTIGDRTRR